MPEIDLLAERILPLESDRALLMRALCKAVKEAQQHRWYPWPWAQRVTEEQERLDALMREANLVKRGGQPCAS